MRQLFGSMLAFSLLAGGVALAGGNVESGLKEGEFPKAFTVLDVTGPKAGERLCYRCRFGPRPVVSIFARGVDENLARLVKQVDAKVAENQGREMQAFVVVLSDDVEQTERQLVSFKEKHGIQHVPLTVFRGQEGPADYEISKDAGVTVLMWKKLEVKSNHAFANSGALDAKTVEQVVADTAKILE